MKSMRTMIDVVAGGTLMKMTQTLDRLNVSAVNACAYPPTCDNYGWEPFLLIL